MSPKGPSDILQARRESLEGFRPPGWIVLLFGAAAVALLPWILLRISALPAQPRAAHWHVAWGGLDLALALLLLAVALAALRRSPWLEGTATAAATLLLTDAWFDVLTTSTRMELLEAIGEAAIVEVPLAVICLLLARKAKQGLLRPPVPVILQLVPDQPVESDLEDRLSA
jgi:hypothetical protein